MQFDLTTGEGRLRRLVVLLREVAENHPFNFNLSFWVDGLTPFEAIAAMADGKATPNECGTTACAVGWAATLPEFRELGLKITGTGGIVYNQPGYYPSPSGYFAAASFFGIRLIDAQWLFSPDSYGMSRGAGVVADRIEKLLKRGL